MLADLNEEKYFGRDDHGTSGTTSSPGIFRRRLIRDRQKGPGDEFWGPWKKKKRGGVGRTKSCQEKVIPSSVVVSLTNTTRNGYCLFQD